MLCKKAQVPVEDVMKWIKEWKVTVSELSRWILGVPARPQYNSYDQF